MKTKSRKKNYVAVVNGVLSRHLIGRNLKNMPVIKKNGKNFYFFSNSKESYEMDEVLSNIEKCANNGQNFCFGVFQMKNSKKYYFLCEIDPLHITNEIIHVHSKVKTLLTKNF